ncbi:MAG: phosphatidylserine decarboxylase [Bryobacteraceae bacterium]|nr:phosphatidylserine decarboxylase [Solibacteraceae bacterium]MCL4842437.1 phosphatidylserine decarboxylase [Bryobacteraceae bacterium]MCO5350848.1 phosphatidylserine decarboxylase [Bryobacteraceae bacterium]
MVVTGLIYALVLAVIGGGLAWLTQVAWAGAPFYALALFCLWFFRDPDREIPTGPVAVSPADGKVVRVRRKPEGTQVCIFLNVFDVHVNRSPIAGKVTAVEYTQGKFLVASKEAASYENERNTLTVDNGQSSVRFAQIAGLIARRIVCTKRPGDYVTMGERIGLIKFGSRVDVDLGPEWEVAVREGERVSAGSSILAKRKEA